MLNKLKENKECRAISIGSHDSWMYDTEGEKLARKYCSTHYPKRQAAKIKIFEDMPFMPALKLKPEDERATIENLLNV